MFPKRVRGWNWKNKNERRQAIYHGQVLLQEQTFNSLFTYFIYFELKNALVDGFVAYFACKRRGSIPSPTNQLAVVQSANEVTAFFKRMNDMAK